MLININNNLIRKHLISFIIPCYNSYSKMNHLLNSFENQTCDDFEVIFVDDCSKDNTYDMIYEYTLKCSYNVLLIKNEENSGPGISRNNGLLYANSDFISFVDADDYIDYNFVKECKEVIEKSKNVDCIVTDYQLVNKNGMSSQKMYIGKDNFTSQVCDLYINDSIVYVKGGTWGKVYRRNLLVDNNLGFLNLMRNEDTPFTKNALSYSKRTIYLRKPLYYYIMQPNSLTHTDSLRNSENSIIGLKYLEDNLANRFYNELEAIYAMELYILIRTQLVTGVPKKLIKDTIRNYEKKFKNIWKNKYIKRYPLRNRIAFLFIKLRCFLGLRVIEYIVRKRNEYQKSNGEIK